MLRPFIIGLCAAGAMAGEPVIPNTPCGNGVVHDFMGWVKIVNNNPTVDKPATSRVQFAYRNEGTKAASGLYWVTGGTLWDPAAGESGAWVGDKWTLLTFWAHVVDSESRTPEVMRYLIKSANLVANYKYWRWVGGQKTLVSHGTETAPNLGGRLVPSVQVDSIVDDPDYGWTAIFEYKGNWDAGITYPVYCQTNRLVGAELLPREAQKTLFSNGLHRAFRVKITGADGRAVWNLGGRKAVARIPLADAPTSNG